MLRRMTWTVLHWPETVHSIGISGEGRSEWKRGNSGVWKMTYYMCLCMINLTCTFCREVGCHRQVNTQHSEQGRLLLWVFTSQALTLDLTNWQSCAQSSAPCSRTVVFLARYSPNCLLATAVMMTSNFLRLLLFIYCTAANLCMLHSRVQSAVSCSSICYLQYLTSHCVDVKYSNIEATELFVCC